MNAWIIVAILYLIGALAAFLIVRKWKNVWYEKMGAVAVWPGTLILYVIHLIHNRK